MYVQDLPPGLLRQRKTQRLQASREEYRRVRKTWAEDPGYDAWFNGELNNAKLAAAQAYHQYVDAFLALLDEQHGDLNAFYARAEAIGELPMEQRERCLRSYLQRMQATPGERIHLDCPR